MNLLITRHDKIGDFILALPMIFLAKRNLQNAKIFVLVSKINYDFAKKLDFVDEVILYENDISLMTEKLKKYKIDVSISAFIDTKLAFILFLSGIKKRYAPATKIAQFLFNCRIKQRRSKVEKKEFEYNIDLLKAFLPTIDTNFPKPILNFSQTKKSEILREFKRKYTVKENAKLVGFHPGFGGSSDGNLSIEDYLCLARSLSKIKNIQIIFTFGPDDKKSLEFIKNNLSFDAICFESDFSLMDFCIFLSNFELFVSTSTGPMHLAGAVNIKTLSFFGSSLFASAKRWGSINEENKQNNFCIPQNYSKKTYETIQAKLKKVLSKQ